MRKRCYRHVWTTRFAPATPSFCARCGKVRDSVAERRDRQRGNRTSAMCEVANELYKLAVREHGHDETHSADWPSCLAAHIAMSRYRQVA